MHIHHGYLIHIQELCFQILEPQIVVASSQQAQCHMHSGSIVIPGAFRHPSGRTSGRRHQLYRSLAFQAMDIKDDF